MAEQAYTKKALQADSLKFPPHSLEAEQSVLGGLMIEPEDWDKIADRIQEKDFYRSDHRLIFNAINQLCHNSRSVDVLTVMERLRSLNQLQEAGGEVYLFELAKNTPSAANISAYADIVRERSVL